MSKAEEGAAYPRVDVRVSAETKRTLQREAAARGMTTSALVKERLSGVVPAAPDPAAAAALREAAAEYRLLRQELNRVGVNLNQIARATNAGTSPTDAQLRKVLVDLAALWNEKVRRLKEQP